MRLIHTADLHLGASVSGLRQAKRVRAAGLEALAEMIAYAEREKIKYFVIAGDLFDKPVPAAATVSAVRALFAAAKDILFLVIAGNHDPLQRDGSWCGMNLPENVKLFGASAEVVSVPEGSFIGQSLCVDKEGYGRLSFPAGEDVRVGILHGVLGAGDRYFLDVHSLENPPQYLALGHIHKPEGARSIGGMRIENAGSPTAHGFDETGVRSFLDVTVTKQGVFTKRVETSGLRFYEDTLAVGENDGITDILDKIAEIALSHRPEDIFRIRLTGESAQSIPTEVEEFEGLAEIINDTVLPAASLKKLAEQASLIGYFTASLLEKIEKAEGAEKEKLERALRLGLEAAK